jgi:nucleoside-diphosphate-sugar epimerase
MAVRRVLVTGVAGFIASYIMPGLQGRYDLTLLDVRDVDREGRRVEGVATADLTDPDRSGYQHHFEAIGAVIHLGHKSRKGEPLDDFHDEMDNVRMVYNVLRCAYDASVPRVVVASSNHAADWYEHFLIHERKMEVLDPYAHPSPTTSTGGPRRLTSIWASCSRAASPSFRIRRAGRFTSRRGPGHAASRL